ncbi:MAG: PAS domain S-box protein, partial [Hydrogenovibrio sp.]|uniref:PAS domain S-box protein n=1 Tax=Hydrogenovibrio sp. TaxID=2065821 RepID=UPI0028706229
MINKLYQKGWYEWLLAIGFTLILGSVFALYQVHRDYADKESERINTFAIEQSKLEIVSHMYGLRNQLKVRLETLAHQVSKSQRQALQQQIDITRKTIVEKGQQLRALEWDPDRSAILQRQVEVLNEGLSEQLYYESLINDFGAIEEAKNVLYTRILPIQNHADVLLSDYNHHVLEAFNHIKTNLIRYQQTRNQAMTEWILWVVLWVLTLSGLVFWLVAKARRWERHHADELESQVTARTLELESAQSDLQRALAEQEAIFHSAPDAIIKTDRSARIVGANPAVQTLFGYAPDELIGQNVKVLMPYKARHVHDERVRQFDSARLQHSNMMGQDGRVEGRHKSG